MKKSYKEPSEAHTGYVYVLTNPCMPGLVKVGFTRRETKTRVDEISSSTGVPVPFKIAYAQKVRFPDKIEHMVHSELKALRVNRNREFFLTSPAVARKSIVKATKRCGLATNGRKRMILSVFSVLLLCAIAFGLSSV